MKTQKTNPSRTVLTICVGFILLYLITKWEWTIAAALVIGLAGLFSTYLSLKIDYLWMKLTWLLSLIIPNILLCIIFFFLLLPIALLSRLFGNKDPLNLSNKVQSTFHDSNKQFDRMSFEKPW
jgi:ABC-type dipeptide/oligopeptide/nickel transport system permease subunit